MINILMNQKRGLSRFSKLPEDGDPWAQNFILSIKAKFYRGPILEAGNKVCINGPGHMTNMAAKVINSNSLKKSSSPEPIDRFQ